MTLKTLKCCSVEITNGEMMVHYPRNDVSENLCVKKLLPKFNGCYAVNNSTVAFINEQMFVTPYTKEVIRTLQDAGFSQANFYVPFSNCDKPADEKSSQYWDFLRQCAHSTMMQENRKENMSWCQQRNISIIPHAEDYCLLIPEFGITTKAPKGYESLFMPFQVDSEPMREKYLGKYKYNNGVVLFINADGITYLAKGRKLVQKLQQNGFQEAEYLYVPLSNGETIVDKRSQTWEELPKNPNI